MKKIMFFDNLIKIVNLANFMKNRVFFQRQENFIKFVSLANFLKNRVFCQLHENSLFCPHTVQLSYNINRLARHGNLGDRGD